MTSRPPQFYPLCLSFLRRLTAVRLSILWMACLPSFAIVAQQPEVYPLWPSTPPNEQGNYGQEHDTSTETSGKVAGHSVIRLTDVTRPTLHVYRPAPSMDTGTSVIICPGGGHRILAWDLEGTEVAQWLNRLGITGIVLKYRVPARYPERRWLSATQDAHRAIRYVRAHAEAWHLNPNHIGILGFSAGGHTAAFASYTHQHNHYPPMDPIDAQSSKPDFTVLIYPAYLILEDSTTLDPLLQITAESPPLFLTHALNDGVSCDNSLSLARAYKSAGASVELHLYADGGHGFGLRPTEQPCTSWPDRCEAWMRHQGWLTKVGHP